MATKTLTAPLAIVKVIDPVTGDLVPVGKMRNIRITETIRRGRVTGIGRFNPSELPALEFTGTMNVGFYNIDFKDHPMKANAIKRVVGQLNESFVNEVLFGEGLVVNLLRKFEPNPGEVDENGLKIIDFETFAIVQKSFITSDGFDVTEGQISGRDSVFEYTDPIIYDF